MKVLMMVMVMVLVGCNKVKQRPIDNKEVVNCSESTVIKTASSMDTSSYEFLVNECNSVSMVYAFNSFYIEYNPESPVLIGVIKEVKGMEYSDTSQINYTKDSLIFSDMTGISYNGKELVYSYKYDYIDSFMTIKSNFDDEVVYVYMDTVLFQTLINSVDYGIVLSEVNRAIELI